MRNFKLNTSIRYRYSISVFILLFPLILISQTNLQNLGFVTYNTDHGLSNNSITCITQDKYGFIWIGTKDGLNRFDGKDFLIFRNTPGDSSSVAGNHITALLSDSKGRLWVGTDRNGLSIFNHYTSTFKNYARLENIDVAYSFLTSNNITSIKEAPDGKIWVATSSGFNCYREKEENFIRFYNNFEYFLFTGNTHELVEDKGFSDEIKNYILQYENKQIFVDQFMSDFIKKFGKETFDLHEYNLRNSFYRGGNINDQAKNEIRGLSIDSKGNIWMGLKDFGIITFNPSNNTFTEYKNEDYPEFNLKDINSLKIDKSIIWISTNNSKVICFDILRKAFKYAIDNNEFYEILNSCIYSKNKSLIASNAGLVVYDNVKNDIIVHTPSVKKKYSLPSRFLTDVFVDKAKNIWIGTSDEGLSSSTFNKNFNIYNRINPPIILQDERVKSIFEDSDGDLWIGYFIGGLDVVDKSRQNITNFKSLLKNPAEFKISTVFKIFEDSEKNIWIGTHSGGLQKYNKSTKILTTYLNIPGNPNSISSNDIRDIDEDENGNLWITTHGGGLNKLDKNTEKFVVYRADYVNWSTGMIHDWLHNTLIDNRGNLWISSVDGVSIFNPKLNKFNGFKSVIGDLKSLSHSSVYQVFQDSKNNIWLATKNGLNLFNPKDSSFRKIGINEGLASGTVNAITEDALSNLWISTAKGLSKISPYIGDSLSMDNIKDKIINFDEQDGLQGNEYYDNSCFKTSEGIIYFGGINGINYFHPNQVENNPIKPLIYITDFKLNNKKVMLNNGNDDRLILSKEITHTNEIELNYNENSLGFRFVALNYIKPNKNKYAYKLEGFNKDWQYIDNNNEIDYTNLNPGNYVLRVKAANNDGLWSEKPIELFIHIKPPFWQTWWFRTFIVVAILLIFTTFYQLRTRTLKQYQKVLESKVEERTIEIINKNNLLQERQQRIEDQSKELKESNLKLSELNKVKNRLFSIIGHDLKNPLNAIIGISDVLNSNWEKIERTEIAKLLGHINNSAKGTLGLLNNLLTWARSQSKIIQFNPEPTNINLLVEENKILLKELLKNKNISFENSVKAKKDVFIDQNMIDTVIRNLITNAIKFTPIGGGIKISSKNHNDSMIELIISDTGVGISEKNLLNLFKIDKKFSTLGTEGERGTGLGLVLCKEFIDKHKGRIWVESVLNKGSNFHFTIPVSK